MRAATDTFDLTDWLELTPVEGKPNLYVMQIKTPATPVEGEMTEADWDKFEKDINDAFEQVP